MALVRCEDCGRNISDLSRACIHCGRPLSEDAAPEAEEREPRTLTGRARTFAARVREVARGVGSGAKGVLPNWTTRVKEAVPLARELPSRAIKKLIQDRDVEVLVLPTGSNPATACFSKLRHSSMRLGSS